MSGQDPIAAAGVSPGDVLAGKYRVERVLGVGGMGVVVAAEHIQLRERVALKFLHPEVVKDEDAVRRFLREAQSAVRIKSEHVARVTDVGTLENGAPYMVMEYLTGIDLAGELEQRGALDLTEVADLLLQACDAIAEAHSIGIVHRDLKPSNLFLTRRADGSPLVKVLDFGISKNVTPIGESKALTQTTSFVGSPYYMSPEQLKSARSVDARSDVWALGVVLFELLTKAHPFEGETLTGLMIAISTEPPKRLAPFRPDLDARIEHLVLRCLERDVSKRVQNVAELAMLLAPFASAHSLHYVDRVTRTLGGVPTTVGISGSVPPYAGPGPNEDAVKTRPIAGSNPSGAAPSAFAGVDTSAGWADTNNAPIVVPTKNSKGLLVAFATVVTLVGVAGVVGAIMHFRSTDEEVPVAAANAVPAASSAAMVPSAPPPAIETSAQVEPAPPAPSATPKKTTPPAPPAAPPAPAVSTAKKAAPNAATPPPVVPPPAPKKSASGSAFDTQ